MATVFEDVVSLDAGASVLLAPVNEPDAWRT